MIWEELLAQAEERLRSAGVWDADGEARRMLTQAAGCEDTEWLAVLELPAGARGAAALEKMLSRRERGEPLQYVLGCWGFRKLDLMLDNRVFIPRPETEMVTGIALAELQRMSGEPPENNFQLSDSLSGGSLKRLRPVAVDLGCGSGAIGLSLVVEHPAVKVYCTDVSADAIEVARSNLAGLGGPAKRVRLAVGHWYEALPEDMRGHLSLIVSNPPYIAQGEELPPSVEDYEPALALRSGPTGLEATEAVLAGALEWLAPGGALVIELHEDRGEEVRALAKEAGLAEVQIHHDLLRRQRALFARRYR